MANRSKDYQDSRVARLNFAVLPAVKDDLTTLASMRKITLNELGNQIFTEYIKKYEKKLAAYADFISDFDNDDEEAPVTQQKSSPVKNPVSDEQKEDAIKKIILFINDNRDKIIDEKAQENNETLGYIVPARQNKIACVAIIAEKIEHLIDSTILKALKGNQININGNRKSGLIRIEDPDLVASFNSSS